LENGNIINANDNGITSTNNDVSNNWNFVEID
jgi:hypothetical protein